MTALIRQTIRDTFHSYAVAVGLEHVGGRGAYSEFEGTTDQWGALVTTLSGLKMDRSVRSAIARAEWARG